jgi:hypothetical protein
MTQLCETCEYFAVSSDNPYRGKCQLTFPPYLERFLENKDVSDSDSCDFYHIDSFSES